MGAMDTGSIKNGKFVEKNGGISISPSSSPRLPTQWNLNPSRKAQLEGLSQPGAQCLINSWTSLDKKSIQDPYCPAIWDEIYCWPATEAGEIVSRPCSEVMKEDVEVDAKNIIGEAYRICSSNGTWLWGNWTNYNQCLKGISNTPIAGQGEDLAVVKDAICYILFIGSILSIICLCISLFIFYYFKSIRCDRITVHINLMVALAMRSFLLIIITEPFIFNRTNNYRTVDWLCKCILALHVYAMLASINWMFIQGHHLHSRFTKVFDTNFPLKVYCSFGWGLPLCLTLVWSAVTEVYHGVPCWKNYGTLPYNWIIVGPMLILLCVNLMFLANILRIVLKKIQLTKTASQSERFKRAVKDSVLLFPLLGINNLVFCYNPGGSMEVYYMLVNTCLQSSQGIFVSILYCFICRDVIDAIRRKYSRFKTRRMVNSIPVRSQIGRGNLGNPLMKVSRKFRQRQQVASVSSLGSPAEEICSPLSPNSNHHRKNSYHKTPLSPRVTVHLISSFNKTRIAVFDGNDYTVGPINMPMSTNAKDEHETVLKIETEVTTRNFEARPKHEKNQRQFDLSISSSFPIQFLVLFSTQSFLSLHRQPLLQIFTCKKM